MIEGNSNTAFRFEKFKVTNFSFNEPQFESKGFNLKFETKGIYNENDGEFKLFLNFVAFDKVQTNVQIMSVNSLSIFKFHEAITFDEIPDHFFSNSIPIVFPFLRAFTSTLTLQANANILMLGLLNFAEFKKSLFDSTDVIKKNE